MGNSVFEKREFGCGGECHPFDSAMSILLRQAGVGNPKPTADLFSDYNCKTMIQHAGIFKGEHSGCTSFKSGDVAHSAYLYFDC